MADHSESRIPIVIFSFLAHPFPSWTVFEPMGKSWKISYRCSSGSLNVPSFRCLGTISHRLDLKPGCHRAESCLFRGAVCLLRYVTQLLSICIRGLVQDAMKSPNTGLQRPVAKSSGGRLMLESFGLSMY